MAHVFCFQEFESLWTSSGQTSRIPGPYLLTSVYDIEISPFSDFSVKEFMSIKSVPLLVQDLLDVGSTAAEGLSHASQVLFEGYAVLTDLAVQVSFSRVAEKTHSRFNGKNPDLNPDNA